MMMISEARLEKVAKLRYTPVFVIYTHDSMIENNPTGVSEGQSAILQHVIDDCGDTFWQQFILSDSMMMVGLSYEFFDMLATD